MYILEGFECAQIGTTHDNIAVYDYDKCVQVFVERESWTAEEAIEWMEYNVVSQKLAIFVYTKVN
jgi:hypothetical protein